MSSMTVLIVLPLPSPFLQSQPELADFIGADLIDLLTTVVCLVE